MIQLPAIHLIHTSDAPQHLGKLKEILHQLKVENRINTFTTWSLEDEISSLSKKVASGDLVFTLLTQALEPQKEKIEDIIRKSRKQAPGLKVAEIIVDNIPYENEFITFPADLQPIRSRADMDAVWRDIAQNLREMFPAKEVATTSQWPKYLKIAGIVILVLVIAIFLVRFLDNDDADRPAVEAVEESLEPTEEAIEVPDQQVEEAIEQPVEEAQEK